VLGPLLKENMPKVLQSNNSSEFTNTCMKELPEKLNIKCIISLPYKPSNGQVEHFNRTIKGMILQYMPPITSAGTLRS